MRGMRPAPPPEGGATSAPLNEHHEAEVMTTRGMRLRLGLFVVLAAGLLAILIVMFGSVPTLFKGGTTYTVRFTDAPGLAQGAPVRRSGVRVGTVQDIVLDEDRGIVRVKIAVDA